MDKRLSVGLIILLLCVIGILLCVIGISLACYLATNCGEDRGVDRNPHNLSSYNPEIYPGAELGFFTIDPETILKNLEQGETDVFQPLLEDPQLVEEIPDISISWTQADFLNIASALGQLVWNDPMDLEDWGVDYIVLRGSCRDESLGFHSADITYYKTIDLNGEQAHVTRRVEIDPYFGMIRWGGGAIYPQSGTDRWDGVDLSKAKITADDALRIAEENGGKEVRLRVENKCGVIASLPLPHRNDNEYWFLEYGMSGKFIGYKIDMYTGEMLGKDR